jgi:tetratricopeptide (TPR) repeat protein
MRKSESTDLGRGSNMKTTDQIRKELVRASRDKSRGKSMRLARQGLSVTTPDSLEDWAFFGLTLARLLVTGRDQERDGRIKTGEIEEALQLYGAILNNLSFAQDPRIWANAQLGIALAYDERRIGDREDNLQKAIHHYEESLKFFTRQRYPNNWGEIKMAVAAAYSQRKRGSVVEHLRSAIKNYKEALEVFPEGSEEHDDIRASLAYLEDELTALAPSL